VRPGTATPADLARTPLVAALPVRPGTYRLRAAAIEASGRAGVVDGDVHAALLDAPPVRLSGLLLGVPAGGSVTPRLLFTNEPVVVGYLEVSGAPENRTITVDLALAATETGPAIVSSRARMPVAGRASPLPAYGGIPIAALPPGEKAKFGLMREGKPIEVDITIGKRPRPPQP
jgi:hypothetical protein